MGSLSRRACCPPRMTSERRRAYFRTKPTCSWPTRPSPATSKSKKSGSRFMQHISGTCFSACTNFQTPHCTSTQKIQLTKVSWKQKLLPTHVMSLKFVEVHNLRPIFYQIWVKQVFLGSNNEMHKTLLAFIALSAAKSPAQTRIQNAILVIDTSSNASYNQVHWLVRTPYLSIKASNESKKFFLLLYVGMNGFKIVCFMFLQGSRWRREWFDISSGTGQISTRRVHEETTG